MKGPSWKCAIALLVYVGLAVYLSILSSQLSSLSTSLRFTDGRVLETPLPAVDRDLTCLAGIVTVEPGGRLANQIFELLSAWAVARHRRLELRVPEEIMAAVQGTYRNLGGVNSLEGELRHGKCRGKALNVSFVFQHALAEDFERDIEPFVDWATRMSQPVVLR